MCTKFALFTRLEFITQIKPYSNQVSDIQQAKHYDQSEMPEKSNILKYENELPIHKPFTQIYGHKFHVHTHQTVKINRQKSTITTVTFMLHRNDQNCKDAPYTQVLHTASRKKRLCIPTCSSDASG